MEKRKKKIGPVVVPFQQTTAEEGNGVGLGYMSQATPGICFQSSHPGGHLDS